MVRTMVWSRMRSTRCVLRTAIDSGYTRDFDLGVPLGDRDDDGNLRWHFFGDTVDHRKWEAPTAGFVYDLQGPDAQAVTMPPAPPIVVQNQSGQPLAYGLGESAHGVGANPELVAEMAEVYWLALLRDQPLAALEKAPGSPVSAEIDQAAQHLGSLDFYQIAKGRHPRRRLTSHESLSRQNVFRGHTQGDRKGPYLSQFMLMGDEHIAQAHVAEDGQLSYGAIRIDMKVRKATSGRDYMTHWNEWLDVQNGADVGGTQEYEANPGPEKDAGFRFIATLRDLATYVHFDALYEAYLNACLWLLKANAPFDPNFPPPARRHQAHHRLRPLWRPAHPVLDDRGRDPRAEGRALPEVQHPSAPSARSAGRLDRCPRRKQIGRYRR